jgi:glycosyltransferase involved in cell wall biosynthesis
VLRYLNRLMADRKFDVIDFAEYGAEGFAYQLDRTVWNFAPVVVQLHGPIAMFAQRIGWPERGSEFEQVGAFMEGVSIQNADALMACSANIADYTAARYSIPRDQIDVVHCGVDADAFTPRTGDAKDQNPIVLFVGNVAANKGILTVFDAALAARSRHPRLQLYILGKGDPELLESLRARSRDAGHGDLIGFAGFVRNRSELPEYYRRAAVFTSPATHEVGVANVYIEAMACGCPVIAANTGGAPEAVVNGQTGLLVPPGDVAAMTCALDAILSDRSRRQQMGAAGRKRVDSYFAMDHYIQRVLHTYNRAIEVGQRKLAALESNS